MGRAEQSEQGIGHVGLEDVGHPSLPLREQLGQRRGDARAPHPVQELGAGGRRSGPRVEQQHADLAAVEGLIQHRQVRDHHREQPEPGRPRDDRDGSGPSGDVAAEPEGEQRRPARQGVPERVIAAAPSRARTPDSTGSGRSRARRGTPSRPAARRRRRAPRRPGLRSRAWTVLRRTPIHLHGRHIGRNRIRLRRDRPRCRPGMTSGSGTRRAGSTGGSRSHAGARSTASRQPTRPRSPTVRRVVRAACGTCSAPSPGVLPQSADAAAACASSPAYLACYPNAQRPSREGELSLLLYHRVPDQLFLLVRQFTLVVHHRDGGVGARLVWLLFGQTLVERLTRHSLHPTCVVPTHSCPEGVPGLDDGCLELITLSASLLSSSSIARPLRGLRTVLLDERQGGVGDLAPAAVDRERVPAPGS